MCVKDLKIKGFLMSMIRLKRMSIIPKDLFLLESTLTDAGIETEWAPQLKYWGGWYSDKDNPYLRVRELIDNELIIARYDRRHVYVHYSSTEAPNFDKLMDIAKKEYPYSEWAENMIVMGGLTSLAAMAYLLSS